MTQGIKATREGVNFMPPCLVAFMPFLYIRSRDYEFYNHNIKGLNKILLTNLNLFTLYNASAAILAAIIL